jgi:hypothetical protein
MKTLNKSAVQYEATRDVDDRQVMAQARLSIEDYFDHEDLFGITATDLELLPTINEYLNSRGFSTKEKRRK